MQFIYDFVFTEKKFSRVRKMVFVNYFLIQTVETIKFFTFGKKSSLY